MNDHNEKHSTDENHSINSILCCKIARPRITVKRTQFFNLLRTPSKIPKFYSLSLPFIMKSFNWDRSTMVKWVDSNTKMPGFESWLYHYMTLKDQLPMCAPVPPSEKESELIGPTSHVGYYHWARAIQKKMTKTSPSFYYSTTTWYYISCYMSNSPHQKAEMTIVR